MLSLVTVLLASYLIGSIPSSLWMGKLYKSIDIRDYGSGNAGATNTFRILGWKAGVAVLMIDFSKGFLCTAVISQIAYHIGSGPVAPAVWDMDSFLKISCGLLSVTGHMFPLYASFEGGKGAATAAGMLYGIEPLSISISVIVFVSVILLTRYVSLGTMIASIVYPLSQFTLIKFFDWSIDTSVLIFTSVLALVIIAKHHANIRRLWKGTENRVSSFKPSKGRINEDQSPA
ncbi:MAG: glycerol-3-phosphate 1-O-acyltransferase PlsY [Balneolaceae bacterium]